MRDILVFIGLATALHALPAAAADAYPARPVRMLIPYPPGGGLDLPGRAVGQKFARIHRAADGRRQPRRRGRPDRERARREERARRLHAAPREQRPDLDRAGALRRSCRTTRSWTSSRSRTSSIRRWCSSSTRRIPVKSVKDLVAHREGEAGQDRDRAVGRGRRLAPLTRSSSGSAPASTCSACRTKARAPRWATSPAAACRSSSPRCPRRAGCSTPVAYAPLAVAARTRTASLPERADLRRARARRRGSARCGSA